MAKIDPVDRPQVDHEVRGARRGAHSRQAGAASGGFEDWLRKMLHPDESGKVNEEALFAGAIQGRLYDLKGRAAAEQYGATYRQIKQDLVEADGGYSAENAARLSLRRLESSGVLTQDERALIRDQCFAAAQLDDNTEMLYDSNGTSQATNKVNKAVRSAVQMMDLIDVGQIAVSRGSGRRR